MGGFTGTTGEGGIAEAGGNIDEGDGTSLTTRGGVEDGMAEALPGAAKTAADPPAGSKSL